MSTSRTTRTGAAIVVALASASIAAMPVAADPPAKKDRPAQSEGKGQGSERSKEAKETRRGDSVAAERRCKKGKSRAYVTRGTLVSQALTVNADGTVDGTVVVDVDHTNRHARADEDKQVTYTLDDSRLKVITGDRNADNAENVLDAAAGDRVKLTGRVSKVKKKCADDGSKTITFRRITVAPPKPAEQGDD